MKGYLIVNDSLNTPKFNVIKTTLVSEAKKQGIDLILKTNAEMFFEKDFLPFAIFYDKDVTLAKYLESMGVLLFNSAQAIENCDDKAKTYLLLDKFNILQPKTLIAPLVFGGYDWEKSVFIKNSLSVLNFPIVVKERFGSFGSQVFLAKDKTELISIINSFQNRPFILQEFISKSQGVDLRVEVVGGKAVCGMLRTNKNDFRANLTNGGVAYPHTVTDDEAKLARTVSSILGLDFCGVDILFDGDKLLVCEVNSNAHFENLSGVSGINIGEIIIKSIKEKLQKIKVQ